jgi:acyl-coenzyme A thioesterase PaaI-like protein
MVNAWPPLFFAGIKVTYLAADYREARVTLKLRWYNRNYVGVQYGGSLMSMTDPWYMLLLMHSLGKDYFVWDKHAEIDFIAPGKTHVHAQFKITEELLADIRAKTASGEKYVPEFSVDILDEHNKLVARVKRRVYIKLKPCARGN